MDDNIFGERLKKLREDRGWSKAELARRLNIKTYTNVTHWENGRNMPNGDILIKLVRLYGVTADYLLGLSDDESKHWKD